MRLADVAFDVPLLHAFTYRIPDALRVAPGQRILAPLHGAERTGVVLAVREGPDRGLKTVSRLVDEAPLVSAATLDLAGWIARQSLSSVGSTCLALLPPPRRQAKSVGAAPNRDESPAAAPSPGLAPAPELLAGAGREGALLDRIEAAGGPVLVLTPDVEGAARWAKRLGRIERVVRLDSGVGDAARAAAWQELARGSVDLAVGTRSALLAPLRSCATLALIDEHEIEHKPPGPPHMHAREVVLERASRERLRAVLTSATPSVETWWRCETGAATLSAAGPSPWPSITVADSRGLGRREALMPALSRAIRETLAAGRRIVLVVSRLRSSLGCDECGAIVRCEACGIALAYSPARRSLGCRLCGRSEALPETCAACRGRKLSPFGWSAERIGELVRRRFPRARVARYEPDTARGRRGEAERAAAAAADVVVGTRGALRLFGRATLGLAGFVVPDQLLGLPDFRAAERAFSLMWAAAERVRPDGAVVIQSRTPSHYALEAVVKQDLAFFYRHELEFRGELGYPPFRRLAVITVRGADPAASALAATAAAALAADGGLTVYPPAPGRRRGIERVVVKGDADLPERLAAALEGLGRPRRRSRGIMDVEVDPVEWPY